MIKQENIRNFSIIAHIDHGKSTLADRLLELCHAVPAREMEDQIIASTMTRDERLQELIRRYFEPRDYFALRDKMIGSGSIGGGLIDISNGFRITMDGSGAGIQIFNGDAYGSLFMILPLGGFITLGCLIALMQYLLRRSAEKKELKEQEAAE